MASKRIFYKAAADVLDFYFDFKPLTHGQAGAASDWLEDSETITAHEVTADGGITVDSSAELDGTVTAWLSGGAEGRHKVYCEITTSAGRTAKRWMIVEVG